MTDQLQIRDEVLESAGTMMLSATRCMSAGNRAVPNSPISSLTGVGGDIREFLRGVQTGRLALGDAAKTSCEQLAALMNESGSVDCSLAASLPTGFALHGGKR
ncbi:hypothetical protein [Leucobacter denitrificans]|uniref:Uncharacterized protein n=1 Tax=Leucobacter denitrificans TaxID=683042 RepID=A0A7G9S2J3_9MICO|nr:hypothetical protein [Leucobacter denitrificans]QNN62068.1 hypothetical protein H9L06_07060 [Leucobacter denitrificans]